MINEFEMGLLRFEDMYSQRARTSIFSKTEDSLTIIQARLLYI